MLFHLDRQTVLKLTNSAGASTGDEIAVNTKVTPTIYSSLTPFVLWKGGEFGVYGFPTLDGKTITFATVQFTRLSTCTF